MTGWVTRGEFHSGKSYRMRQSDSTPGNHPQAPRPALTLWTLLKISNQLKLTWVRSERCCTCTNTRAESQLQLLLEIRVKQFLFQTFYKIFQTAQNYSQVELTNFVFIHTLK